MAFLGGFAPLGSLLTRVISNSGRTGRVNFPARLPFGIGDRVNGLPVFRPTGSSNSGRQILGTTRSAPSTPYRGPGQGAGNPNPIPSINLPREPISEVGDAARAGVAGTVIGGVVAGGLRARAGPSDASTMASETDPVPTGAPLRGRVPNPNLPTIAEEVDGEMEAEPPNTNTTRNIPSVDTPDESLPRPRIVPSNLQMLLDGNLPSLDRSHQSLSLYSGKSGKSGKMTNGPNINKSEVQPDEHTCENAGASLSMYGPTVLVTNHQYYCTNVLPEGSQAIDFAPSTSFNYPIQFTGFPADCNFVKVLVLNLNSWKTPVHRIFSHVKGVINADPGLVAPTVAPYNSLPNGVNLYRGMHLYTQVMEANLNVTFSHAGGWQGDTGVPLNIWCFEENNEGDEGTGFPNFAGTGPSLLFKNMMHPRFQKVAGPIGSAFNYGFSNDPQILHGYPASESIPVKYTPGSTATDPTATTKIIQWHDAKSTAEPAIRRRLHFYVSNAIPLYDSVAAGTTTGEGDKALLKIEVAGTFKIAWRDLSSTGLMNELDVITGDTIGP